MLIRGRSGLKEQLGLAGPDLKEALRGLLIPLDVQERDAFPALAEFAEVRLEQERIPRDYGLNRFGRRMSQL